MQASARTFTLLLVLFGLESCGHRTAPSDGGSRPGSDGAALGDIGQPGGMDGAGEQRRLGTPGSACASESACRSARCLDGVCCATPCQGKCLSCSRALTGAADGACAPVRAGLKHGGDCMAAAAETCGEDGSCDGAGGCRLYGPDTICASESCDGIYLTPARGCDGHGGCTKSDPVSCTPYVCKGSRCGTSCAGVLDCLPGSLCVNGICSGERYQGGPCSFDKECGSLKCVDGVCCESSCAQPCFACSATRTGKPNGVCAPVKAGADSRGTCSRAPPGSCANSGKCNGKGGCELQGLEEVCGSASCAGNAAVPIGHCDGAGACAVDPALSCGTDVCVGGICQPPCASDGDCGDGQTCSQGDRVCRRP